MKIIGAMRKYKMNPASVYIIKTGFLLMLILYICAAIIWTLLGTAADFEGMLTMFYGLAEAAPASFGAAFAAGVVCDIWHKEYAKE